MSIAKHLSRRNFLQASSIAALSATVTACAAIPTPQPVMAPEAPVANADEALQRLIEGNKRYVANKSLNINESESRRIEVAKAQHPFATVFSCVDSRVPPELVFDRGLGDLFVMN
ncbi:MAG: carbonic anhydrase [Caldilineaceae bacterium]